MTRLDILSDPICPWCFIGKAHLDRARSQARTDPFEIRWRPFQLNPEMPPEGMDRQAYLAAKFGGAEAAARIYREIEAAARAAGIEIDFGRIARTPNTLDAHRLIEWAEAEGVQAPVVSMLFDRYFRAGDDISDHDVLVEIAETATMDAAVTRRLLAGDADRGRIREADATAREMGVSGVPTFLLGGRYVLTGAQPAETWTRLIDELETASATVAGPRQ